MSAKERQEDVNGIVYLRSLYGVCPAAQNQFSLRLTLCKIMRSRREEEAWKGNLQEEGRCTSSSWIGFVRPRKEYHWPRIVLYFYCAGITP